MQPKAQFPKSHLDWKELLYMRSWQGEELVKFLYYVMVAFGIYNCISYIIIFTIDFGAGGFFLGLLIGLGVLFLTCLMARLFCEGLLSLFSVRDSISVGGQQQVPLPSTIPYNTPTMSATASSAYQQPNSSSSYQQGASPQVQQQYETL